MVYQDPQSWLWDSYKLYNKLFGFLHSYIFEIDVKSHTLRVQQSYSKRAFWCLNVTLNITINSLFTSLYVIIKWYTNPYLVSLNQIVGAISIILLCLLISCICAILYIYRDEQVLGVNTLFALHMAQSQLSNSFRIEIYHKIVGMLLKGMVWLFWLVPWVLIGIIWQGNIDPWQVLLDDITPTEWKNQYPLHVFIFFHFPFRLCVLIWTALEACRFFAVFFLVLISGVAIYSEYLCMILTEITSHIDVQTNSNNLFDKFTYCKLVVKVLGNVLNKQIGCLMTLGFWITVLTNVGLIQGWNFLSGLFYFLFGCVNGIALLIIYVTLPHGTNIHENTRKALQLWKRYNRKRNCLQALRIRSLAPIAVTCGPFLKLTKNTKSSYFMQILQCSCDLNLSLDFRRLFSNGISAY